MAKQELLGENTRENIYHCIKCGLCIAHCPVYKEVLLEEATPRGKVQLSRYLSEGSLELTEDVKEAFFSTCLLCGSCVANCPSGVHGDHLFSGVRWRAVQRYGIDWKKRMMFQLLASKWKMSTSAWFGKWARKMFGGPWIESKLNAGALDVERIPPFNAQPFSATVPEVVKPEGKVNAKVLYFHGCATNYLYGAIGEAVVDVLKKMGVEVIIPKDQTCCGLPIFMSGERETALTCIRENLKLFARKDVDAVVVDCATCGAALKNEYAHLLRDLRQLGEEVTDEEIAAAELLGRQAQGCDRVHRRAQGVAAGDEGRRPEAPGHLPRSLPSGEGAEDQRPAPERPEGHTRRRVRGAPRGERLLRRRRLLPGGARRHLPEDHETQDGQHPRRPRRRCFATCCPGCNLTIANHLDEAIRVLHPVQLLQKALNA